MSKPHDKCICCERKEIDLRFGVCFECASIEEIIKDGKLEFKANGFTLIKGHTLALAKTKAIIDLIKKTSYYP